MVCIVSDWIRPHLDGVETVEWLDWYELDLH